MPTQLQLVHLPNAILDGRSGPVGEVVVSDEDGRLRSSAGVAGGKKIAFLSDLELGAWQTPSLNLGWIGLGGTWADPQFRKNAFGEVRLRGAMQHATASSNGVIFTLPAGFRPLDREFFVCYGAGGPFRVDVYPNGDVETTGANMFGSSFGGVSFYID